MWMNWWSLPGPDRFLDWLFEDFREGRSVVGVLPVTVPEGFRDELARRVSEEGFCWREVRWRDPGPGGSQSPIEILFRELEIPGPMDRPSVRKLLRAPHPGRLVVWVGGLDAQQADRWLALASEYASEAGSAGGDPPRLCISCTGVRDRELPRPAVLLAVRRYAAAVGPLDTLLLTSRLLEDADQGSSTLRALRSAIATELAGTDPSLAYRLVSEPLACLLDPKRLLLERASELGWARTRGGTEERSEDRLENWNGRSRLHSSAVALDGNPGELSRRIWRAQVQVLFPVLEELRVGIVEELRGRIPLPFFSGDREIKDLQELELAQLRDQGRKIRVSPKLQDVLDNAAAVRNQIAHLAVVSEGLLRKLEAAERL